MKLISKRPAAIKTRSEPGHWEADLVISAVGGSAIATLVERPSRLVMLGHLGCGRSADLVNDSLIANFSKLPAALRGTLTWDQVARLAEYRTFSLATNMNVYFFDPESPWQRGSNENSNGVLRQYFPGGVDLLKIPAAELRRVADELNERPRKSLDWDTHAEPCTAYWRTHPNLLAAKPRQH